MAFIPHQFYSNYTFPTTDLITELTTPGVAEANDNITSVMDNTIMWSQEYNNFIPVHDQYNGAVLDHIVSQDWDTMSMSSAWMPAISDFKMGFYDSSIGNLQNFSCGYQPHHIGEFEEDIKPPNTATENWEIHGNYQMAAGEEPNNIKVERYTEEERKERILRYLKKRNQRNFNKTIKYACRKTLADRRVRVRGRFARNNELSEEDKARKKRENNHKEDMYGDDSIQFQLKINEDDDDWLHEAMASLVYLSHSSPDDIYSFSNNDST